MPYEKFLSQQRDTTIPGVGLPPGRRRWSHRGPLTESPKRRLILPIRFMTPKRSKMMLMR